RNPGILPCDDRRGDLPVSECRRDDREHHVIAIAALVRDLELPSRRCEGCPFRQPGERSLYWRRLAGSVQAPVADDRERTARSQAADHWVDHKHAGERYCAVMSRQHLAARLDAENARRRLRVTGRTGQIAAGTNAERAGVLKVAERCHALAALNA